MMGPRYEADTNSAHMTCYDFGLGSGVWRGWGTNLRSAGTKGIKRIYRKIGLAHVIVLHINYMQKAILYLCIPSYPLGSVGQILV